MSADTHSFAVTFVESLEDRFFDDETLDERRFRSAAPAEHYAATCASTAAFRAFHLTGAERFYDVGERLLSYYLSLPEEERSHEEFNSFALLEMMEDARAGRYDLPVSRQTLSTYVEYSASLRTREGNNWLLLQALCREKYSDLFGDEGEHERAMRLLQFSERWRLNDGIIADEPRYPLSPDQTPLTYHAKMSMILGRFARRSTDARIADEAERHLHALARLCMPNGEALYYGRSENTIFGYANALDAFAHPRTDDGDVPGWRAETKERLVEYLLTRFDPERGNCQPRDFSPDETRPDSYIYDVVYGSYAAMLLLGLPEMSPESRNEHRSTETGLQYAHLPDSGFVTVTNGRTALGLTVSGQIRLRESGPDLRYAGMVPHSYVHETESVHPGVPLAADELPGVPFLPVIREAEKRYAPVRWESTVLERDSRLTIRGDGKYYEFSSPPTEASDSGGNESLVRRLKELVKRNETARRVGWQGVQATRRALEATRLDLVYENYETRPVELRARTRRSLHYLPSSGAVIVQTGSVTPGKTTVRPTSAVVSKSYDHTLEAEYSGDVERRKTEVRTHKGEGYCYVPEADSRTSVWSVLVLDPQGEIERTESFVESDRLTTRVDSEEFDGEAARTQLPTERTVAVPDRRRHRFPVG
jgi:hypothetical protein